MTPAAGDLPQLSPQEYQEFSNFLRAAAGIDLGCHKQYLVATRTRRILTQHRLSSIGDLLSRIKIDSDRLLRQQVIDAMTTNETYWFRDEYPFSYLADVVLPEYAQERSPATFRVWSAACSYGQEPYSLSMIAEEFFRRRKNAWRFDMEILATDLSSAVLDSARQGTYDRSSIIRGLSEERTRQFFVKESEESWTLIPDIRNRVRFRPLNLQESFRMLGRFQVIFCRNVLIYFSSTLKQEILMKIHAQLQPGGLLFLGSSESISGLGHLFEMVYCKPGVAYRAKKES